MRGHYVLIKVKMVIIFKKLFLAPKRDSFILNKAKNFVHFALKIHLKSLYEISHDS